MSDIGKTAEIVAFTEDGDIATEATRVITSVFSDPDDGFGMGPRYDVTIDGYKYFYSYTHSGSLSRFGYWNSSNVISLTVRLV